MGCQNRGATLPSERLPGGPKTWPVTPGLGWATLRLSGPSQSEGDELASDLTHPLSLSDANTALVANRLPDSGATCRTQMKTEGAAVGWPGALQPPAPTDPGVTVSRHRALLISLVTSQRTHCQWTKRRGSRMSSPSHHR